MADSKDIVRNWMGENDVVLSTQAYRTLCKIVGAERAATQPSEHDGYTCAGIAQAFVDVVEENSRLKAATQPAREVSDAHRDAICQSVNIATKSGMLPLADRLREVLRYLAAPISEATAPPGMPAEQEPKYGIRDNRLYNRASGEFIPFDEPVFIFRARDWHAAPAIAGYMVRLVPSEHRIAVEGRMRDFATFARENPARMKEPDTATQQDAKAEQCARCGKSMSHHYDDDNACADALGTFQSKTEQADSSSAAPSDWRKIVENTILYVDNGMWDHKTAIAKLKRSLDDDAAPSPKRESLSAPFGSVLSVGQILAADRRSDMSNDEALRFGRVIESMTLRAALATPRQTEGGGRPTAADAGGLSGCTSDMYHAAHAVLNEWGLLDNGNCIADEHRGIVAAINAALAAGQRDAVAASGAGVPGGWTIKQHEDGMIFFKRPDDMRATSAPGEALGSHGDTLHMLMSALAAAPTPDRATKAEGAAGWNPTDKELVAMLEDGRDAERYRFLRNLPEEWVGIGGQPCVAMPNGAHSGYYLTAENADFAVDASMAEHAAIQAQTGDAKGGA